MDNLQQPCCRRFFRTAVFSPYAYWCFSFRLRALFLSSAAVNDILLVVIAHHGRENKAYRLQRRSFERRGAVRLPGREHEQIQGVNVYFELFQIRRGNCLGEGADSMPRGAVYVREPAPARKVVTDKLMRKAAFRKKAINGGMSCRQGLVVLPPKDHGVVPL